MKIKGRLLSNRTIIERFQAKQCQIFWVPSEWPWPIAVRIS